MQLFINILFEYNYIQSLAENQNRNDRSDLFHEINAESFTYIQLVVKQKVWVTIWNPNTAVKQATGPAVRVCGGKWDRSPNAAIFRPLLVVHHSCHNASLAKQAVVTAWGNKIHGDWVQNAHWSHMAVTLCDILLMLAVRYLKPLLGHIFQFKKWTLLLRELLTGKKIYCSKGYCFLSFPPLSASQKIII